MVNNILLKFNLAWSKTHDNNKDVEVEKYREEFKKYHSWLPCFLKDVSYHCKFQELVLLAIPMIMEVSLENSHSRVSPCFLLKNHLKSHNHNTRPPCKMDLEDKNEETMFMVALHCSDHYKTAFLGNVPLFETITFLVSPF